MGLRGGYKLVDFGGTNFIPGGSAVTIPKIYSRATALFCKRFVACNILVNGIELSESDMMTYKDSTTSNLICKVGDYILTITPQNAVSLEQSKGLSQTDIAKLNTITNTTEGVTYGTGAEAVTMDTDTYVEGELSADEILVNSFSDIQTGSTNLGDELDGKVDEVAFSAVTSINTATAGVYGVNENGNQGCYLVSNAITPKAIALRDSSGRLNVQTCISTYQAANKRYVDSAVAAAGVSSTGVIIKYTYNTSTSAWETSAGEQLVVNDCFTNGVKYTAVFLGLNDHIDTAPTITIPKSSTTQALTINLLIGGRNGTHQQALSAVGKSTTVSYVNSAKMRFKNDALFVIDTVNNTAITAGSNATIEFDVAQGTSATVSVSGEATFGDAFDVWYRVFGNKYFPEIKKDALTNLFTIFFGACNIIHVQGTQSSIISLGTSASGFSVSIDTSQSGNCSYRYSAYSPNGDYIFANQLCGTTSGYGEYSIHSEIYDYESEV